MVLPNNNYNIMNHNRNMYFYDEGGENSSKKNLELKKWTFLNQIGFTLIALAYPYSSINISRE